ncbi:MAG: NnrU family protein [Burkholderiales bacterium]
MMYLLLGLILFLGIHSVSIVAPGWRDARSAAMGQNAWKGLYSIVSIAGFALLIYGYGLARQQPVVLYTPPAAMRHIAMLLMLPVFPLLLAAYLPGWLKRAAKHPMLLAVKFWALAHLLVNGNLADVLLFGGFLLWAAADRVSMKHRVQRPLPGLPASPMNDVIAVVAGLAIYALFLFWAHASLIGIALM